VDCATAGAADSPKEDKANAEASAATVQQLALAHELAKQGRRAKSPLALLTAAQILRSLKMAPQTVDDKPQVEGDTGSAATRNEAEIEKPLSPMEESQLLLQDARTLAGRQLKDHTLSRDQLDAIETLARQVESTKISFRGARGGPQQRCGFLHPGQTNVYRIDFNGLTPEYVRVFGNGRTMLSIAVLTPGGALRGEETAYHPGGTWYSRPGGNTFTIRIRNVGNQGTSYRLITN
jgi:hypothetical protein